MKQNKYLAKTFTPLAALALLVGCGDSDDKDKKVDPKAVSNLYGQYRGGSEVCERSDNEIKAMELGGNIMTISESEFIANIQGCQIKGKVSDVTESSFMVSVTDQRNCGDQKVKSRKMTYKLSGRILRATDTMENVCVVFTKVDRSAAPEPEDGGGQQQGGRPGQEETDQTEDPQPDEE